MLSTVASVYAVFVYSIAFALEMWFIFTSDLLDHNFYSSNSQSNFESSSSSSSSSSLSANANVWSSMPVAAFAFILAAIYFITLVVSLLLMLGIIVRSMVCLLVWLVTFGLLFFPECGLVLHLSLNVWVRLHFTLLRFSCFLSSVFRIHFISLFSLFDISNSELILGTVKLSCAFTWFEPS